MKYKMKYITIRLLTRYKFGIYIPQFGENSNKPKRIFIFTTCLHVLNKLSLLRA